jgi:hypothetical protein
MPCLVYRIESLIRAARICNELATPTKKADANHLARAIILGGGAAMATDMENAVELPLAPVVDDGSARVALNRASLWQSFKSAPAQGDIAISWNDGDTTAGLACGDWRSPCGIIENAAIEFPAPIDNSPIGTYHPELADDCATVAAKGDYRFAMNGVFCHWRGIGPRASYAASDTHRLIVRESRPADEHDAAAATTKTAILPTRAVALASEFAQGAPLDVYTVAGGVILSGGHAGRVFVREIQGQFPRYLDVIPKARRDFISSLQWKKAATELRKIAKGAPGDQDEIAKITLACREDSQVGYASRRYTAEAEAAAEAAAGIMPHLSACPGAIESACYDTLYFAQLAAWCDKHDVRTLSATGDENPIVAQNGNGPIDKGTCHDRV